MNRMMCFMNKIVWYFRGVRSDGHAWKIVDSFPRSIHCDRCGKVEYEYQESL